MGDSPRGDAKERFKDWRQQTGNGSAPPPNRIKSLWSSEVSFKDRCEWQVKKIIPAGAMVEIYGLPGCGKSFLAIHLGMAIARAIPFFGQELVTPGFVAYLAAEGGHGIEKRIAAYRQYNIIEDGTEPFLLIPQ